MFARLVEVVQPCLPELRSEVFESATGASYDVFLVGIIHYILVYTGITDKCLYMFDLPYFIQP